MFKRLTLLALAAATMGAFAASSASASTQIGSPCTFSSTQSGVVMSPSQTAKADGVITSWGYTLITGGVPPYENDMYVLSPTGVPNQWTLAATATPTTLTSGGGSVATRTPIKAGQAIGTALVVGGSVAGLTCSNSGDMRYTSVSTAPTPGSTLNFDNATAITPDVYANVEPDADHDGYGDETQDKCPQSASFQTACPTPKLAATQVTYKSGFRALVTTDIPGTVQATGTVKLPKSKGKKAKTLTFKSKIQPTLPGTLTTVTLKWPSSLTKALKSVSKSKKLKVTVTLTVPGILGNSTKKFTVKVPGRK